MGEYEGERERAEKKANDCTGDCKRELLKSRFDGTTAAPPITIAGGLVAEGLPFPPA